MLAQTLGRAPVMLARVAFVRPMASASAGAASSGKVDYIQQIYIDKIKEYAAKSKSGNITQSPELASQLKDEREKLRSIYSRNPFNPDSPDDVTKVPTFEFKDPNLSDVY